MLLARKSQRRWRHEQRAADLRSAQLRSVLLGGADPVPPRPRAIRTARRLAWRGRRLYAPVVAAGGLATAGWLIDGSPLTVAACSGIAAGGWWWARLRHRLDRARERQYAGACLVAAGSWLTWTAAVGIEATGRWLVALGVCASLPWLAHHWPRDRTEPVVEPEPEVPVTVESLWAAHVGDPGGKVPGSTLGEVEMTKYGRSWKTQLVPGRQPVGQVVAALPYVAQGLRLSLDRVVFEQHPGTEDTSVGRLQIIDRSPIKETAYFDRPRHEDGQVLLGPWADGVGEAPWRVYTPNSMWGGFMLGSSGSGKSLDLATPIATPAGWTTMGEIHVGDEVFDESGRVCHVTKAFDVQHGRPCHEVQFSDGERIVADADHQWWTEDHRERTSRQRSVALPAARRPRLTPARNAALYALADEHAEVTLMQVSVASGIAVTSAFLRCAATDVGVVGRTRRIAPYRQNGRVIQRPTPWALTYPAGPLVDALSRGDKTVIGDQRANRRRGQVRTTSEIGASVRVGPSRRVNHSIPVARPLALPEASLLIDPYVLGCWLGDGSSKGSELTTADPEIAGYIEAAGWRCKHRGGYRYSILPHGNDPDRAAERTCVGCDRLFTTKFANQRSCSSICAPRRGAGRTVFNCLTCNLPLPSGSGVRHQACRSGLSLAGKLQTLGVLRNKHVPETYLRGSIEQRRALLAGLLDTDGTVAPQGTVHFDSTNRRLAAGVQELALSLGYRPTITVRDAKLNGRVISLVWRVAFTTRDAVFRLTRKNESLADRSRNYRTERNEHRYITDVVAVPSRPVRCITVDSPSHLFLAGRHMVPTHNSRLIELAVVTVRSMCDTLVIYLDGQAGASSPLLMKHATWSGGPDQAAMIQAAVLRGMLMRQKYNRAHELSGFTPSPDLPGILIVVDECHSIFKANTVGWETISREGRKVGFAILAASQYSGLEVFGNSETLRSSLLAGNGLALRTASRMAGHLLPGLALDPYELPTLPGYGYLIGAPGSGARTAPFRGRYLPDAKDAAETDLPVPTVEQWFERTSDATLDAMTARAFGDDFAHRHEHATAHRELLIAQIAGTAPIDEAPAPGEPADEVGSVGTTTRDRIVAALRDGPLSYAELIGATGKSKSSVKDALGQLRDAGVIGKDSDAKWQLAEKAAA